MRDQTRPGISKEEAERLTDFDSIPGIAEKLSAMLRDVFEVSGVEVTNAFEFQEQLSKIPDEELREKLYNNFLAEWDTRDIDFSIDLANCATAINRHDALQVGERFTPVDRFEPLPWIWVTGEPNTNRLRTAYAILSMCPERSSDNSPWHDCGSDDEEVILKTIFGSYFDPVRSNEGRTPMFVSLDGGSYIFYKAERLSLTFQKRLAQWRKNSLLRAAGGGSPPKNAPEERPQEASGDRQILADPWQETELTDVAVFFVADQAPWELVEQGLVMRELVSGSIHIIVPPLRELPKLIIKWLRELIVEKPTLTGQVSDPLKYWTKGALDLVSSFHWPDNLAGLNGLVDNLFFKGVLRSGKDKITEDHVRSALWDMYGPTSLVTSEHPVQTGSNEFEVLPKAKERPPDRSEWIEIFQEKYQGKRGAVTMMAKDYGINRSLLSTTLNAAGVDTGKGGRPRKGERVEDS